MTIDDQSAGSGGASACPDVETLADFHAGVLGPADHDRIAAIVATNVQAQEIIAALDATQAQLAALPPVEIPADVAARIERALAAEAGRRAPDRESVRHLRATPPAPGTGRHAAEIPQPSTGAPLPPTYPHAAPQRPAGPTGPAGGQSPFGAASSGAAGPGNVVDFQEARAKRANRVKILLGAAAAVVVIGGGGAIALTHGGGNDNVASGNSSQVSSGSSGRDDLTDIAAGDVVDNGSITENKATYGIAGEMSKPESRQQCISDIPQRPLAAPSAVQQGDFKGTDAYAFVFPANGGKLRMIIVKADDCGVVLKDVVQNP